MKLVCANCNKKTTNKCDGCKTIYYCSIECLKANRKKHKTICKIMGGKLLSEEIMNEPYKTIIFRIYMSYVKNNEIDKLRLVCKSLFINKNIIPSVVISNLLRVCKMCFVCNKMTPFTCSMCDDMRYCSILCQRSHFKNHKMYCRAYTDADKYYDAFVYVINKTYSRGHYTECYKWMRIGLQKSKPIKTVSKVFSAIMYFYGQGVEKEYNTTYNIVINSCIYESNIHPKLSDVIYELGVIYLESSKSKIKKKGIKLLEIASKIQNINAYATLGKMYVNGIEVKQNLKKGFILTKIASVKGHMNAQHDLGYMYCHGEGVEVDLSEAMRLWKLSATQGNQDAQYELGWMYYDGEGVEIDYEEAIRLWKLSAIQGHQYAQYNLGDMYHEGKGVIQDLQEALRLFKLSAAQGNQYAQSMLEYMLTNN